MRSIDQVMLAVAGLATVSLGGWLFWYYAIRPPRADRPTHYSLFEIAFLPTGLIVIGVFLLLAAGGASAGKAPDIPPYR
jgi:hypothetical protein